MKFHPTGGELKGILYNPLDTLPLSACLLFYKIEFMAKSRETAL